MKKVKNNIKWFESVDSTNNVAALSAQTDSDKTIYAAEFQTAGRGQKGNKWSSSKGENLTFSILLKPHFLTPISQSIITFITTLGITKYLKERLKEKREQIKIKWPNDIYVGNKKICGILIENTILGERIESSVVGIGLNVNQTIFSKELLNPTSLSLESNGEKFDTHIELERLADYIFEYYKKAEEIYKEDKGVKEICNEYLGNLFRFNQMAKFVELGEISAQKPVDTYSHNNEAFAKKNGKIIKAKIVGITPQFLLILIHENGEQKEYAFKEIGYII